MPDEIPPIPETRWKMGQYAGPVPTDPALAAFLYDIASVCLKHRMSISHEDGHGGFYIENFERHNLQWLFDASDMRH